MIIILFGRKLTWHLFILPSLNCETNIEDKIRKGWYQRIQALLGDKCPHIDIDGEFDVILMSCKRARFGNEGGFAIISLDEFGYTGEDRYTSQSAECVE